MHLVHKIRCDFEIQIDHLILARSDNYKKKEENLQYSGFCTPSGPQRKNQRKQKDKVLRPCQRTKKAVEHEGDGDTTYNWHARNGPQKLEKRAGRVGNQRKNENHSNYCTVEYLEESW